MTIITYMIAYCGIAVFLVAVVARFVMWSRMPMHVRWELYPVAHEGGGAFHNNGAIYKWNKSLIEGLDVLDPRTRTLAILDGADAARFLDWICRSLEQPLTLFLASTDTRRS